MENIILNTPKWIWLVACYLIFIGVRGLKERLAYIPKLFVVPIVLICLKHRIYFSNAFVAAIYSAILLLTILASYIHLSRKSPPVFKDNYHVKLPGSYSNLVIFTIFFMLKFIFGYLYSVMGGLYQKVFIIDISISAILSGYFLGKALFYWKNYKQIRKASYE